MVVDALREAGAVEIVIAVPEIEAPFERIVAAGADGIAVPLRALTTRQWEQLAEAVEAGKRLWAGALQADGPGGTAEGVADVVESVRRPWQQLGLPAGVARHATGHAVGRPCQAVTSRRDGGPYPADPGCRRPEPAGARLISAGAGWCFLSFVSPSGPAWRSAGRKPGAELPAG